MTSTTSVFRLYETDGSANVASIFDLIVGTGSEPRQTKAFGYVLSRSSVLMKEFLKLDPIAQRVQSATGRKRPKFDHVVVDAEMVGSDTAGQLRADVVVRFFEKHAPVFALVIEAKSAKKAGAHDDAVVAQLRRYITGSALPAVHGFPIIPVALTRFRRILPDIASLTWNDIRTLAHNNSKADALLFEFHQFLQRTGSDMQYFEREILSVPAGGTAEAVQDTCIHACPDTSSFSYKIPLRITFRQKGGGSMHRLYKVLDILSFDPLDPIARKSALESSLTADERNRLTKYLAARDAHFGWGDRGAPFRFYILSTDDIIDLPHSPKPPTNIQGHMYFRLCDILDQNNAVVPPAT